MQKTTTGFLLSVSGPAFSLLGQFFLLWTAGDADQPFLERISAHAGMWRLSHVLLLLGAVTYAVSATVWSRMLTGTNPGGVSRSLLVAAAIVFGVGAALLAGQIAIDFAYLGLALAVEPEAAKAAGKAIAGEWVVANLFASGSGMLMLIGVALYAAIAAMAGSWTISATFSLAVMVALAQVAGFISGVATSLAITALILFGAALIGGRRNRQ